MTFRRFLLPALIAAIVPAAFGLSLLTADAQSANTRTFGALGREVMNFIYYEKAIMPNDNDMTIDDDALTTQRVCQLAGYSTVQSVTKRYFASCGDNRILSWNGSAWQISPACSRDGFISTLVCSNPIASSSSSFSSAFSFNSSNSSSSVTGGFSAIDVKINGQDGTVNAPLGSTVVISWNSNGVQRCDTDGSESPWGPNRSVPVSGSETVTVTKSMTFAIQCAQTPTSPMIVMDVVGVSATSGGASSASSFSSVFSIPSSSYSSSSLSSIPSSASSQISSTSGNTGCIQVYKQAYDTNGNEYPVTPQFTFRLDGGTQTALNTSDGHARFNNVPTGTHTVTETLPTEWRQLLVTPENGVVNVSSGQCTGIVFINRQMFASGSSSSTSSSSSNNSSSSSASSNSSVSSLSSSASSISSSLSSVPSSSSSSVSSSASSITSVSSSSSSLSSSSSSFSSSSSSVSSTNLSIFKTDNRISVNRGERIAYLISITNNLSVAANNLTVTDDLPSMVTFASASDNGSLGGNRVTWTGVSVPANSTAYLTVTVDVKTDATGTITNTATVNGNTAIDNSTVNVPQTFLGLTKSANYQQVGNVRTIDYTVRVTNNGANAATNLFVIDTPSSSVTVTDAGGGTVNGGQIRWDVSSLAAGDSRTFQYRVSVNAGVGAGAAINNTVQAGASNASTVQVTLTITTLAQAGQAIQFAQSTPATGMDTPVLLAAAPHTPQTAFSSFLSNFLRFLSPISVIQAIAATI